MRDFARRLIDYEALGNKSEETKAMAAFQACQKLRPHLATLMGNGGFRALLARSLALATAEVPELSVVQVKADGTLEGVGEFESECDQGTFFEAGVVLLAHLLGLLVAFIGAGLTVRLVREVWPDLSLPNDFDFGNGDKYEKKK